MEAGATVGSDGRGVYKVKITVNRHYFTQTYGWGGTYKVYFNSKVKAHEYLAREMRSIRKDDPAANTYDGHPCGVTWKIKRIKCEDDAANLPDTDEEGETRWCTGEDWWREKK
jgi:hypothetical protein